MDEPLKVLFLTRYPLAGASSRYRVFQYIPSLEKRGIDCTVQSFMDANMYQTSLQKGRTLKKISLTLFASLKRLKALLSWKKYDIIYMQRELFPFKPTLIERALKKAGAVLFFDYDDALFIKKASRYSPLATLLKSPNKTLKIFKIVDCVITGNNWLRDAAIKEGAYAVTVEVAEDTQRIPMRKLHNNDKAVTIGWLGSPSTVKYLHFIAPVLRKIAKAYPDTHFEIIGGGEFEMEGVPWTLFDWSLQDELKALERFDIGLMPLPMEDWAKGKSGGKARTYMAAGVVPICSAIGYNLELIDHGETGLLCQTDAEWEKALILMVENADKRNTISRSARKVVETRFSIDMKAAELEAQFRHVLAQKSKST